MNGDYTVWTLLQQTAYAMERAWEEELREYGLNSAAEARVLLMVAEAQDPITPAKLSRGLLREPHTISGLLNRMETRGLITKEKNLERANLVRVTLTPEGNAAYAKVKELKTISKILSRLPENTRASLVLDLGILVGQAKKALQGSRTRIL